MRIVDDGRTTHDELKIRVAQCYRYAGVPRYLGVPVWYRGIYEYKYSTAVCGHHTVFFLI